jgi:hypothetical protein
VRSDKFDVATELTINASVVYFCMNLQPMVPVIFEAYVSAQMDNI